MRKMIMSKIVTVSIFNVSGLLINTCRGVPQCPAKSKKKCFATIVNS